MIVHPSVGRAFCVPAIRPEGQRLIVRSFLAWTTTASAASRAEGAAALTAAYIDDELDAADRRDAEVALMALLDDGSPLVRMAIARVCAGSTRIPHAIVTALAGDRSDIAALLLEFSPLLGDNELVDAVAVGDATVQAAVARRPLLRVGVAAAIAEVATLSACRILCDNASATIAQLSLARLIERFGDDARMRETIGARPDIEPGTRAALVAATARALARFVSDCGWLSADRADRVARDALDQATIVIAADAVAEDGAWGAERLVDYLRESERLTPALILRALLCGNLALFEAAVSRLSGVPLSRVSGLIRATPGGLGFSALYAKARLPSQLMPVFEAAARAACHELPSGAAAGSTLRRSIIAKVIDACVRPGVPDLGKVTALLRNLEAQAAREDSRAFTSDVLQQRAASALPHLAPDQAALPMRTAA